MTALRGSCQCGAVRFVVTEPFDGMSFCHCATCKKISGGVGTASGRVRSPAIRILEGRDRVRTYRPDEGSAKSFCSACGSNLFGGGWPASESASVRLSAIDDPIEGKPTTHIFVRSVAPWETLPDDGLERYDTLP